ncbi:TPA: L,D-transpeptidase [Legionella pneumophila]|uniref:Enhanced entry protein EnhA n=2 Tax=Legionella pneumophila TaxID=446 RepID=Q5ZS78_LEGPH|nr:L,D-transpeptidase [Legionella pneumophila]WBV63482.1 L,D-transpeptidase [Legionella pneumophila 130b]AAU28699.1 enhanced entry protein EnhA [Legionella pneumophila subsp. pneumophila str. Philadelphia 1]AEW52876.1 enhanced entry protein EnhA [Legionella pneumophila subsp. pneumophila ATCC 43290]AGH52483.1 Enhanced entry protein EnhA [Legionella pneumophila subsp. pneumophila LPE509]AGN15561.1 enhanced entry protein EnhA [Legionella pneumophila subsp. pneumophila str. Thunder Bay]
MKKILLTTFMMSMVTALNAGHFYGTALCAYPQYECIKVTGGQSWEKLFPDPVQRDIVQRVNRTYNYLWSGREIAVPKNLANINIFDVSPFPLKIQSENEKQIIVDQEKLAWGAYDAQGNLVWWGPISSGSDKCSDSNKVCRTLTGIFRVFSKENVRCTSDVFPIGRGGAKMPYCMYFHKGFALHGSDDIPGVRASHGCVRMFIQDAKWLNENFVELSSERNNFMGTKVIVRPLNDSENKK